MENFECQLCFKKFPNGRALGGHMRSHLMNHEDEETESSSFASSTPSSQDDGGRGRGGGDEGGGGGENKNYGLRENPKRSIHFIDGGGGSLVVQDRESETESYSKNPTRKRSKRVRRTLCDSWFDSHEPVLSPSVSDTTTEEDVAICLMMLSRDNKKEKQLQEDQDIELSDDEDYESYKASNKISKGRYKCETCSRVFKSYQALGGHRASHKKGVRVIDEKRDFKAENVNVSVSGTASKKIHECPYCFRVFSSGQALGGHKRTHTVTVSPPNKNSVKFGAESSSLIDLNLPPTTVDDEVSAVSDAEFVNQLKW